MKCSACFYQVFEREDGSYEEGFYFGTKPFLFISQHRTNLGEMFITKACPECKTLRIE